MIEGLCLVHLVWAPLGPQALERFVESYRRHSAGVPHRLLVLLNGFLAGDDPSPWRETLDGVAHEELLLAEPMLDLGAYRRAAELVRADRYCFVNSYSVVRQEGWLEQLDRHLRSPGVGIVGTGGSYESAYSAAPRPLRPWRRDFDPFPNPHIRTNGFAMEREVLISLDWPMPARKLDAWRLESGQRGLSRQIRERGLSMRVVGRDGMAYPPERWRESRTFRSGDQSNQLLSDNRTVEYETVDRRRRLHLERLAWGDTVEASS